MKIRFIIYLVQRKTQKLFGLYTDKCTKIQTFETLSIRSNLRCRIVGHYSFRRIVVRVRRQNRFGQQEFWQGTCKTLIRRHKICSLKN